MNQNRLLGIIAMLAAPFLFVDFLVHGMGGQFESTSFSGIFSLIYMTGWVCSIIGLLRLKATGETKFGRVILWIQLLLLFLANIWNAWVILQPGANDVLFRVLDMFWPVSNAFMMVIAITAIRAKKIKGWRRFVPLFVALWLPVGLLVTGLFFGRASTGIVIAGTYSAIAWMLLGYVVATNPTDRRARLLKERFNKSDKKYLIAIN